MKERSRISRNLTVVMAVHVVARLLYLVLLAVVGRTLGAEGLGGFAIATAIGAAFLLASDLGLAARLVREAAARVRDAEMEYARSLGAKVLILPVLCGVAAMLYPVLHVDRETARLSALMVCAATIESFSYLNHALYRARERFDLDATGELVQAVTFLGVAAVGLFSGLPMASIGYAAIVAAAAELFVSTAFARRFARLSISLEGAVQTLRHALPYAMTTFGVVALAQLDVLVLSLVASPEEVGHYAAASRLLLGGAYIVMLAGDVVLPTATAAHVADEGAGLRAVARPAFGAVVIAAAAAALLVIASAHLLVRFLYGPGFESVAVLLQLGGVFVVLKICSAALQTMLTVAGRQSARALSVSCGLIFTAATILALGSTLGATGAVIALACGEAAALVTAIVPATELIAGKG